MHKLHRKLRQRIKAGAQPSPATSPPAAPGAAAAAPTPAPNSSDDMDVVLTQSSNPRAGQTFASAEDVESALTGGMVRFSRPT